MKELDDLIPEDMNFKLCEYFGGKDVGVKLQITNKERDGYVQLSKTEALALSSALLSWVRKNTKEKSNVD